MSVEIRNHDEKCREIDMNGNTCCVCRTVKLIDCIQRKSAQESCISCNAPRLGQNVPGVNTFNTRPFILYLPNGERFQILIDPLNPAITTSVFRVEEVRDCCAILRGLLVTGGTPGATTFECTNFCVNVDLCEMVAIQCLNDTFIICPVPTNTASLG